MTKTVLNNFITKIIKHDLDEGRIKNIATRFAPTPNGYLHIGHAQCMLLNHDIARQFNGKFMLRYDDTNPYDVCADSFQHIKDKVELLGCEADEITYASDYFERMMDSAFHLIRNGKAYVCYLNPEEMGDYRGSLKSPGKECDWRNTTVESNLAAFEEMIHSDTADGHATLRAKINMSANNICMRDPVLYTIKVKKPHAITGKQWRIYPTYDFAHPLSDFYEGISHSICTLEFTNNRELYNWVLDNCVNAYIQQIEFSRLNIAGFNIGKRFISSLIKEGTITGWGSPEVLTLAGMLNKGYPVSAIKRFCYTIGVSKESNNTPAYMLDKALIHEIDERSIRIPAVINPLHLELVGYKTKSITMPLYPANKQSESVAIYCSNRLLISGYDFTADASSTSKALKLNGCIRLLGIGTIRCIGYKNNVIEAVLEDDTLADVRTIQWVCQSNYKESLLKVSNKNLTASAFTIALPKEFYELPITYAQLYRIGYVYKVSNNNYNLLANIKKSILTS